MAIVLANGMSHPWSRVSIHLMNGSPMLTFILSQFLSPTTAGGNS